MTDHTIEVVALVVDTVNLTFYKTDGSVYTVTQGDPRGVALSDEFFAQRKLGKEVITLIIGEDSKTVTHLNSPKRNPLIRFFRAPLEAVKKLFGAEVTQSDLTDDHEAAALKVKEHAARLMRSDTSVAETSDELPIKLVHSEEPMKADETIIAVTEDGIIPHVESLTDQFQAGEEGKGSAEGPDNLIIRLTKMSAKRGHTATELMKFIEKIDLPILPDGSFLAYKRLIHQGKGVYVDPHTKLVHQRIGDIVEMDEKLVDPNRRVECSQGLHVGTRHYMGHFHGNAEGAGTMLVLIQPEDVIAVPYNERTKMRASRYLILADLSNKAHNLVNENKRMDDCRDTMQVVAQIVAGGRPAMLGRVVIGGASGSNLTYHLNGQNPSTNISLEEALAICNTKATAPTADVTPVRTIDESQNGNHAGLEPKKIRDKAHVVKPVDAKVKAEAADPLKRDEKGVSQGMRDYLAKPKEEPKATTPPLAPTKPQSERQRTAAELYGRMTDKDNSDADRRSAALGLQELKKQAKVSYLALGLPSNAGTDIQEILDIVPAQKETLPKPSDKKAKTTAPQPKQPAKVEAKPKPKAEPAKASGGTRQDRARALWDILSTPSGKSMTARKEAAFDLRQLKTKAKVSWTALGLGNVNVEAELKKLLD